MFAFQAQITKSDDELFAVQFHFFFLLRAQIPLFNLALSTHPSIHPSVIIHPSSVHLFLQTVVLFRVEWVFIYYFFFLFLKWDYVTTECLSEYNTPFLRHMNSLISDILIIIYTEMILC